MVGGTLKSPGKHRELGENMIARLVRVVSSAMRPAPSASTVAQRIDAARSRPEYLMTIELFRLRGLG